MELDVLLLSRFQFAMTIMFHYLFPPLTIGLGAVLVGAMSLWWYTDDARWESMAQFLTKLFAVNFAVGVATGIVMEFEFGTNWAVYSRYVGDVFGSALAAEGIFAFFLESGFLGILVFGWDRVSRPVHWFASLMVFFGSVFSSIWITVANSWMQTPAGYHIVEGPLRTPSRDHSTSGRWCSTRAPWSACCTSGPAPASSAAPSCASIAAWYLLRGEHTNGLRVGASFLLGQVLVLASVHRLLRERATPPVRPSVRAPGPPSWPPTRATSRPVPLRCGSSASPTSRTGTVDYGIAIPGGLSFLVHGDGEASHRGAATMTPREDWPNVRARVPDLPRHAHHRRVLPPQQQCSPCRSCSCGAGPDLRDGARGCGSTCFAILPRVRSEISSAGSRRRPGRQPWIVWGHLRTSDALSPKPSRLRWCFRQHHLVRHRVRACCSPCGGTS